LKDQDLKVTVCGDDFAAAALEVKPSVSAKELEYYEGLRRQFSADSANAK